MKRIKFDLPPISDEEEAQIQAGIARDPDNPELTAEEIAAMRPAREVLPPELFAALTKGKARATDARETSTEEQITLSIDRLVLEHFRAAGPGWEGRINQALKQLVGADPIATGAPDHR